MRSMKDLAETHEVMRFTVEDILMEGAKVFDLPTCPSQSHRALRMIEAIEKLPIQERLEWSKRKEYLRKFITLNQAIRILEHWPETETGFAEKF